MSFPHGQTVAWHAPAWTFPSLLKYVQFSLETPPQPTVTFERERGKKFFENLRVFWANIKVIINCRFYTYAADPEPGGANPAICASPIIALSLSVAGAVLGAVGGARAVLEPSKTNFFSLLESTI